MKILICGAGIIGQIHAGLLIQAGHSVTLLARGGTLEDLGRSGISLRSTKGHSRVFPALVSKIGDSPDYDVALVTVRRDQVEQVMPTVEKLAASRVAFMLNAPADPEGLVRRAGSERAILAFPGVGGYRARDGVIRYQLIPQQRTTVESRYGLEAPVVTLMRSAGLPVSTSSDMRAWLRTHAVFIVALGAAILVMGGDSKALAADRAQVGDMVAAVGEGFRALRRSGVAVTPGPLRFMFTVMPRPIAVAYWQRELRGDVGTVCVAPHIRHTRETEFPQLCQDVRNLVGKYPVPSLSKLLDAVAV